MTTDLPRVARASLALVFAVVSGLAFTSACGTRTVDVATLPDEYQEPYALFRTRCSRCHTIARPLNAPIRDATHWELYVARMRRVPGSGINETDAREILRFLVYYTEVIRGEAASTGTEAPPEELLEALSAEPAAEDVGAASPAPEAVEPTVAPSIEEVVDAQAQ